MKIFSVRFNLQTLCVFVLFCSASMHRFLCLMGFDYISGIQLWNSEFHFADRVFVTLPFLIAWGALPITGARLWSSREGKKIKSLNVWLFWLAMTAILSNFVNFFIVDLSAVMTVVFANLSLFHAEKR